MGLEVRSLSALAFYRRSHLTVATDPLQQKHLHFVTLELNVITCYIVLCGIALYGELTLCNKKPPLPTKQYKSFISAKTSSHTHQYIKLKRKCI